MSEPDRLPETLDELTQMFEALCARRVPPARPLSTMSARPPAPLCASCASGKWRSARPARFQFAGGARFMGKAFMLSIRDPVGRVLLRRPTCRRVRTCRPAFSAKAITLVAAAFGRARRWRHALSRRSSIELGRRSSRRQPRAGAGSAIGAASVARARPTITLLLGTGSRWSSYRRSLRRPTIRSRTAPSRDRHHPRWRGASLGLRQQRPGVDPQARLSGKLSFASFGMGSTNHLLGEFFMRSRAPTCCVPYKARLVYRDRSRRRRTPSTPTTVAMPLGDAERQAS